MFSRHIINREDFNGYEKRIEMAVSVGRKLELLLKWSGGNLYTRYIVTIGGEEYPFLNSEFDEAIKQYNEP